MKKFWPFIGGIVTGVILTFVCLAIYGSCRGNSSDDVVYFDKPGEPIKEKSFKVFQVLEPGVALVNGESHPDDDLSYKSYYGAVYMLVNDENKYYSDEEIITVGADQEARKVGIFNYRTKGDLDKTVSIIEIMKKKED